MLGCTSGAVAGVVPADAADQEKGSNHQGAFENEVKTSILTTITRI